MITHNDVIVDLRKLGFCGTKILGGMDTYQLKFIFKNGH